MSPTIIGMVIREFLKVAQEYFSRAMLKKAKTTEIEAAIDSVKKAQTEKDFKTAADAIDGINRNL